MTQRKTDRVETQSAHPLDERLEHLKQLYPEAVTKDGIDFDALRNLLGIEFPQKERYQFTWAGKQEALLSLQKRSKGTLKPVPEESVNWDSTGHLFIEGDNLEVLKLLYKSYFGRVKMIYIDPPYNTGGDFVYPDNYADPLGEYLRITAQVDEQGNRQTSRQELNGRKHSAWLSMMYPRLFVARQLLRDDGVIFVSIDDNEVHNLRFILNEIFGEENFIDCIIWKKRYGGGAKEKHLVSLHEYVLFYAKNIEYVDPIFIPTAEEKIDRYYKQQDDNFEVRGPYRTHPLEATKSMGDRPNLVFPIPAPDGTQVLPKRQWLWGKERTFEALERGELEFIRSNDGWTVHTKQYLRDENGTVRSSKAFSIIDDVYTQHGTNEILDLFGDAQVFPFPKPVEFIKKLINIGTETNGEDVVMDFFSGSASTAHAVLSANHDDGGNREFVLVQLPELTDNASFSTIADIGKERIRRVIQRMVDERNGKLEGFEQHPDEDLGFRVFKLDSSAMRQWEDMPASTTTPEEYARQLEMFVKDPLLEGWTIDDVIAEVAIKETGFSLSYRVEQVAEVTELTVYRVIDDEKEQFFYICLDDKLSLDALKPLNLQRDDLLIFRDSAVTDTIVANLVLTCRIKSI